MSTADLATMPRSRPSGRRLLSGTTWLGLRQDRTPLLIAGSVLVLLCGWMVYLHSRIADQIAEWHLQGCNVVYFPAECEGSQAIALDAHWGIAVMITGWLLVILPIAFGLFYAAPLLAREFETGTYALAWTQSVSRQRWLAARLGVPLLLTLVGSSLLAVVSTRFVHQVEGRFALPGLYHWFSWMSRSASGPSLVASCLLSVALGAAVGLVVRRVVASIVVTAVLTVAVRFAVDSGRYLLTPAREALASIRMASPDAVDRMSVVQSGRVSTSSPLESHIVENGLLTRDGLRIPTDSDWIGTLPDGTAVCPTDACKAHYDVIDRAYTLYHPPADEWMMHWTQTGLSLLATAALLVFCALWVRRVR
ncbi:hypothetical protein ABT263_17285 [Kitasatospora sp. NPDC001603]|uniref:hypothetical protein n=1 Tax=Kitasatospora sp. NPDC001603 TaxID=3154388 RepID=UPI00332E64DF